MTIYGSGVGYKSFFYKDMVLILPHSKLEKGVGEREVVGMERLEAKREIKREIISRKWGGRSIKWQKVDCSAIERGEDGNWGRDRFQQRKKEREQEA